MIKLDLTSKASLIPDHSAIELEALRRLLATPCNVPKKGCGVYFLTTPALDLVKIGQTEDFDNRLRQHASSNPDVFYSAVLDCRGMRVADLRLMGYLEKSFHEMFEFSRYKGEWFRFTVVLGKLMATCRGIDLW